MADVTIGNLPAGIALGQCFVPLSDTLSTVKVRVSALQVDYSNITGKPAIPAAQVNSDWNAASGLAQILNKPTIPTSTGLGGMQAFTTSGTFTAPAGVTKVKVTAIGGGGGGGGPWATTPGYVGGAGGVAIGTVTVTPSTSYVISVGGGGSAGSIYGGGGSGGTSQFGDQALITATGGTGGARATQGGPGTAGTGINGAFNSSLGSFMPGYGGGGAPSSVGQYGLVLIEW